MVSPGYQPRCRQHWRTLLGSYFDDRESLAGMFIIVDIRRGIGDYDAQMLRFAQDHGCPAHVLLTKADKLKRGPAAAQFQQVRAMLKGRATVQLFSSHDRQGLDEALSRLNEMLGPDPV